MDAKDNSTMEHVLQQARRTQAQALRTMRPLDCAEILRTHQRRTGIVEKIQQRMVTLRTVYQELLKHPALLAGAAIALAIGAAIILRQFNAALRIENIVIQFRQLGYSEQYLFDLSTLEENYNVASNLGTTLF